MSEYVGKHRGYAAGPWGPYEPKHATLGDRWIREALRIERNIAAVRTRMDAEDARYQEATEALVSAE